MIAKTKPARVARSATGGLHGPGVCPTDPSHGPVYFVRSDGRLWCNNQSHDRARTPSVFTLDELDAARQASA